MNRILRVLGMAALLGMLAAFGPANAAQIQINAGAPYLCAVVEGGNTTPGTPVIAYSCSGGPEDEWDFVSGQIQGIGTANGTAMCLDVYGAGTAAGTPVDLWPCNGGSNQQWQLLPGSIFIPPLKGARIVTPGYSCLDSAGPSVGGGTQLVINPCSSAASQNWMVRGMQIQAGLPSFTYLYPLCANVKGSKTANGTPVIAYACNDAPNELWSYDGRIFGIGTENGTSKCLTASGTASGSLVELSTCNGGTNQSWKIYSPTGGFAIYPINAQNTTNDSLDITGGESTAANGAQLVIDGNTAPWIIH